MPLSKDPAVPLALLREMALGLPDASERPSHGQPTFFAGGKMFAQFRHDHHGDGLTAVLVKTSDTEERTMLIEANPALYSRPAYFTSEWVAIDVSSEETDWDHVGDRVARSWELAVPRALLEAGGR